MIQLNLLPDVKLDYLKAQQMRRLVITLSIIVGGAAIALLALLLLYDGLQKKHLDNLNNNITSYTSTLRGEPQISKVLTVQNQIQSITTLDNGKPAAPRLLDYLNEITPSVVYLGSFNIDFTQQTMAITGATDTLKDVNTYVDTLKFTNFTEPGSSSGTAAFSNVVLSNFSVSSEAQNPAFAASFTIDLSYNPAIFDIAQNVKLSVPNIITTRSELDQPTDLFKSAASATNSGGGQ
jgi:Tfp pilus assembly protein PilN